jgi:Fe-S-cluster containining protein
MAVENHAGKGAANHLVDVAVTTGRGDAEIVGTRNKKKKIAITSENKCDLCHASKCCTYITHHLETPRSKQDFNLLLWQVSHEHVQLYKDEDGWFLLINTPCTHLQPNGNCGIYDQRPTICREHSNDYCEYDAPAEEGFDLFFDSYDSLLAYCRKRFKKWDKKSSAK